MDETLLVPATVTIREGRGVALSRTSVQSSGEGESASYTMSLTSQPDRDGAGDAHEVFGDSHIAVSPDALTFTPDTWHEAQTVTVRAAQDPDAADDDAEVHHRVTGADYEANGIAVPSVQVDCARRRGPAEVHTARCS